MISKRGMKPWHRVYCALARCSEQRWLSAQEVNRIGLSFARCCSGQPHRTLDSALADFPEWQAVGLLKGRPPFTLDHPQYRNLVVAIQRLEARAGKRSNKPLPFMELEILKLQIKGKLHGH